MLLSSVSHDLKTPLASIIGSLSVHQNMFAALPEEQRQELLANALDEAYRLDSFITNILDMTRLESKQVKFRKEWIPPQDILRHVEKRMKERLRFHKLNIHYDTMMNVELCADVMMTEQVIQNLLDNAGKYTPFGTAIDVTLEQAGPDLVIRIRDYGPGIPDDSIEKIFDKYTRLKKRDAKIAGTGLGLAIARTIMHEQCGDIIVANHPDGGAIFNVIVRNWRKKEDNKEKEEAA